MTFIMRHSIDIIWLLSIQIFFFMHTFYFYLEFRVSADHLCPKSNRSSSTCMLQHRRHTVQRFYFCCVQESKCSCSNLYFCLARNKIFSIIIMETKMSYKLKPFLELIVVILSQNNGIFLQTPVVGHAVSILSGCSGRSQTKLGSRQKQLFLLKEVISLKNCLYLDGEEDRRTKITNTR